MSRSTKAKRIFDPCDTSIRQKHSAFSPYDDGYPGELRVPSGLVITPPHPTFKKLSLKKKSLTNFLL